MKRLNSLRDLERAVAVNGPLIAPADAARLLGFTPQAVYKSLTDGRVSGYALQGSILVPVSQLKPGKLAMLDQSTDEVLSWLFRFTDSQLTKPAGRVS